MAKMSTAEKIVAAAGKLLDRECSAAVTMRRIAKSVGITPMALYRHFADRDGLLNALADAGFEEMAERAGGTAMPADAEQQLMKILDV
jgi:AcrR family transcriptional regulator